MSQPRVLCFGSVNVDDVFVVPHIVLTGETIGSSAYAVHAGGKGANQSVALAKAGANVHHAGRIGKDGVWVSDLMRTHNVQTSLLTVDPTHPTGRAIIQVSSATNDNAIVLLPGTNHLLTLADADAAVDAFSKGDWVVLQNEINVDAANRVLEKASAKGLVVVVNPAPCPSDFVEKVKVEYAQVLVLNASEAASIAKQIRERELKTATEKTVAETTATQSDSDIGAAAASLLLTTLPNLHLVIITLGGDGALASFRRPNTADTTLETVRVPALSNVKLVDTTGAGDTFVGYLLAALVKMMGERRIGTLQELLVGEKVIGEALSVATAAAGMACEGEGAMESIPGWEDVRKRMQVV
ncbi:Ribokinase-like protein [Fimicolochytrium jonesii]|uniref:Ribokinase-like protein n=1 Tax=Fimicolochytrium jonesii TaxID=1396493 RepID=UPI0022FEC889|nr:Ribokinase-like protein [Fimicolochytrium jonesii]KAI8819586.1 Ribokinase-like protein [Fimicolochytrium jonesii]